MKILAIITSCKRNHNLPKIIDRLRQQTVKPNEIWTFHKGNEPVNVDCDNFIWANNAKLSLIRFSIGLSVDADYLYYLDDDVFPEEGYLENCIQHISNEPCILGSSGLVLSEADETIDQKYYGHRFWYDIPVHDNLARKQQVDYPLHSYFLKKEHLLHLFEYPLRNDITERGAEIRIAARAWLRRKINCYVIPQTKGCYGETNSTESSKNALYLESDFYKLRNKVIKNEIGLGWKPLFMRTKYL